MKEGISVSCDTRCLETIREFVRKNAAAAGFNRTDVGRLVLAADEVASNIIRHSYRFDWHHKIEVVWQKDEERVAVEIQDDSPVPYLPSMTDFDLPTKVKYRHRNGYGKYLVRQVVDDVEYETVPGSHNKVVLVKLRKGPDHRKSDFANPYEIARLRSLSLKTLFEVWGEMGRSRRPEELMRLFLYTVMGHLSTQPVALLCPDGAEEPFGIRGQIGLSHRISLDDLKLPRHGWVVETLWAHRGPFLAGEFKKLHAPPEELETLEKIRSIVLVPVFLLDRLRGILSLGGKRNRQAFTEDEISLVTLLASHLLLLLEALGGEAPLSQGGASAGCGLREAVRGAIAALAEASSHQKIPFVLEEGPPFPPCKIETAPLQNVILTLLTHILYLSSAGTAISIRQVGESGEGVLLISYNGRPIFFEKGKEGYNPLIDQLLNGGPRLSDCRKVIESAGGKIVVESEKVTAKGQGEGLPVLVRLTLPLAENC